MISLFIYGLFFGLDCSFGANSADDVRMYVANEGEGTVMIVDLSREEVVTTLNTGLNPHAIVFTDHCRAYVNNRGEKFLTVIDTEAGKVVGKVDLPGFSLQLALSPDGKTIAVSYKKELMVSLVDVENGTLKASVKIGENTNPDYKGKVMTHPLWSKSGDFVFVQDNLNHMIVKVDVKTSSVAAKIAIPGANHDLMISTDGKTMYAVNGKTKNGTSLSVIDLDSDSVVSDIAIPLLEGESGKGHHGEFDRDGIFYFCNEGGRSITLVDLKEKKVLKSIETGQGPGHAVLSADGKLMFIIHHQDSMVSAIDTATREVIKKIDTGVGQKLGHSWYLADDGRFLYVTNAPDQKIVKIDTMDLKVSSTIAIGKKALAFAVTDGCQSGGDSATP